MTKILTIFFSLFCLFSWAEIKVLNLSDYTEGNAQQKAVFVKELKESLNQEGFFALKTPLVSQTAIDRAYESAAAFFSLPAQEKARYQGLLLNRGYKGFKLEPSRKVPDIQEYWHVGREFVQPQDLPYTIAPNLWPAVPCDFKPHMLAVYGQLEEVGNILLQAISEAMGERADFLLAETYQGDSILRVIHYLPEKHADLNWKAPHRDPNLLTIIAGITDPGLEIQQADGSWLAIQQKSPLLVVSASNMLENLSNGLFKSTPHRVVQKESKDRYAMPFFIHLRKDSHLAPRPASIKQTGGVARYPSLTVESALRDHHWFEKAKSHEGQE
ncbi:conserved hypothetical protein [Candidatus Protochlamydia naegleriophila]|uniref:2-oxoglutarate-dependent ethylene/succinate-forming enzyme n=1 Tax=Candidatus Protochlamydia naegleriophila TaxID=389348 RepID=A0A0U5JBW9_9BACT|nr:2-oxoglutarate and iron-dependent oxygenase domain-containing protein [Candidatus Protochlamydia naegleriophila]CUI15871.1 conserved hypothetical protein [Candidatus Protochlamydia naegleriophila]